MGGVILGCLFMMISMISSYGWDPIALFPLIDVARNGLYSLSAGLGLAIIGALYPAYRASQMPPADAMRTEV